MIDIATVKKGMMLEVLLDTPSAHAHWAACKVISKNRKNSSEVTVITSTKEGATVVVDAPWWTLRDPKAVPAPPPIWNPPTEKIMPTKHTNIKIKDQRDKILRDALQTVADAKKALNAIELCLIETNGFPVYSADLNAHASTLMCLAAQASALDKVTRP